MVESAEPSAWADSRACVRSSGPARSSPIVNDGTALPRCRELRLRLAVPEDQARQEFTVLLTVQVMNYLHSGGHRLFL